MGFGVQGLGGLGSTWRCMRTDNPSYMLLITYLEDLGDFGGLQVQWELGLYVP